MTNTGGQPAGWYPRADLPGQEDYWDGVNWANTPRSVGPAAPAPAPPITPPPGTYVPPAAPSAKKGNKGCMWVALGGLGLLLASCAGIVALSTFGTMTPNDDTVESESAIDNTDDGEPAGEGSAEPAEKGTKDNPYKFGETHSREPGFSGAGWTVSIDDVYEVPRSALSTDDDDPRICLAVIVTVTLDSLDSDDLVSNPFSMPDINLIDVDGQKAEDGFLECDVSGLVADGIDSKFEVEVTEGGTATYADPVLIESTEYQYVAVESTIYDR